MRFTRFLLVSALLAPIPLQAAEGDCRGEQCPQYRLIECAQDNLSTTLGREIRCSWLADQQGLIRVPYWINPTQPWLDEALAIEAINAAAASWERANPRLRMLYQGPTDASPLLDDGMFVIGWAPGKLNYTARRWESVDIVFSLEQPWQANPCSTECHPVPRETSSTKPIIFFELQGVATHEIGHALGLDHPSGVACGLVMNSGRCYTSSTEFSRENSTLGLGDILGLRALYPFSCPGEGQPIPARYEQACPDITVYVP